MYEIINQRAVIRTAMAVLTLMALQSGTPALSAEPEWNVDTRTQRLMQEINLAQKENQLTDKEAKKLRSDLADIVAKKTRWRDKAKGLLTEKQNRSLEKDINSVSVKLHKLQLEKRVAK